MIFQIFFYYYLKKKMCFHNKKYILLLFCFSSTPYLLHVCSTSIESQNEWSWYGLGMEQIRSRPGTEDIVPFVAFRRVHSAMF